MKIKLVLAISALLVMAHLQAHGDADASKDAAQAVLNFGVDTAEPVAAVERFSLAISAGELDKAAAELAADVVILESGGAEHSRAEYLSGHAKSDAEFLKNAHIVLKNRTAVASSDMAWVASENEIQTLSKDKMLTILSTETMVLKKVGATWKIAHIHWSSRVKK